MPFTVREFPGQRFDTYAEYEEAKQRRKAVEAKLESLPKGEISRVMATIVPAPKKLVEGKVAELETRIDAVERLVRKSLQTSSINPEGLKIGSTLQGESRGHRYTLDVLEEGYLCSNGAIYESLSGAALGVSGNRRSGWKFWRDAKGQPIGEATGRFEVSGHGHGGVSGP